MRAGRLAWTTAAVLALSSAVRAQSGACCNPVRGTCEDVPWYLCGAEYAWYPGITCAQLDPPCRSITGACCDHRNGDCYDWYQYAGCEGLFEEFVGKYCYEIDCPLPKSVYVDAQATGPLQDGTTWCTAFQRLDDGLDAAIVGDTVRVADGVYTPDPTGLTNPREATFNMKSGVRIEGGYAGCGAYDPDKRSIIVFASVLSGDFNDDDALPDLETYDENCYHVVSAIDTDATAVLDGFVVTGGAATRPFDHIYGGGIYLLSAEAVISRCLVIRNLAIGGGGLAVASGSPRIEGCVIAGNLADFGGGVRVIGGPWHVNVHGCSIYANSANVGGAGAAVSQGQHISFMNSILWGNTVQGRSDESAQLVLYSDATVTLNYSCVQGWTGSFGGVGNIGDDPSFIDPLGADALAGTPDDNLRLAADSPCFNAGDPSLTFDPVDVDIDGHARVLCGRVDMGAYEFGIGDADCNGRSDLKDFAALQKCFTGVGVRSYGPGCEALDFEGDGDVDLRDYAAFFALYGRVVHHFRGEGTR